MQINTRLRSLLFAAAVLAPAAAWPGLTGPLRVAQNIPGGGSHLVSMGLRPGGSMRVRGNGPPEMDVKITFVDAGGPVEVRQRGTFVVDIPVSAQPKTSAVFFRMDNRSQQNVRYVLDAD
jgi:hypothetical protein